MQESDARAAIGEIRNTPVDVFERTVYHMQLLSADNLITTTHAVMANCDMVVTGPQSLASQS